MTLLNRHFGGLSAAGSVVYRLLSLYFSNRSLRAWQVLFSHLCRKMVGGVSPVFIAIAPTYRCQCNCVHCYASAPERDTKNELETSEIKSAIDQARRLGVLQAVFSGGEPLLREDIAELVRYAHNAGLLTRINTNGLLLDRERVSKLKEAGLTQCGVSIDDADPDIHDRLRGRPGLYRKAIEGIKNLREFNIPCRILTYASKRNITSGLEKIIALGRRLRVTSIYIFFPMAVGRWDCAFDEVLTEEEKAKVRALQDLTFVYLELPTPRSMCCVFTKSVIYVSATGDVTPCPFVPYVIGNIKEDTLNNMWYRYCAKLSIEYRGGCPMNDVHYREALQRHVESVSRSLQVK